MRVFRKHLVLCTLITLFSGNAAETILPYKDVLAQGADISQDDKPLDYRLPTSVKPISYELKLMPELQGDFKFEGIVKITAVILNATDTITLNVGNIRVMSHTVVEKGIQLDLFSWYKRDPATEKYRLKVKKTLEKGTEIEINMMYEGNLNDSMIGFYKSSYFDGGQIKWLAATQFQPTYARHAFPCFDEPSFKAKFSISILRPINYKCLSNMPLNRTARVAKDKEWAIFQESIPMSTYLVAFIIFEFKPLKHSNVQVWARPEVIDQARYALQIGIDALDELSFQFNQSYELPKMDMVAVPDFAAGAMENWGLVKYRESRMLYDKEESSALAQQSVASTIVHELTHMWFGNMVTPKWWGYLWLSEAFARYFQYFVTDWIELTWNMTEQFVVEQHQVALIADGVESSRPMTRNVSSQLQIGKMGDAITYAKGASIINMMAHTFNKRIFRMALRDYLQDNKNEGLGHPDTLWTALQDLVDLYFPRISMPVKMIMDTWTRQAGYPVVSVTIDDNKLIVTQKRFFLRNLNELPTNVTWHVPLTWTTKSELDFVSNTAKYWLSDSQDSIKLNLSSNDWVIFNIQSSGFYRVNYDDDGWKRIFNTLNSIKFNDIHVLNRAAIMDDLLNLGRTEDQKYKTVLDGTLYLKRWETHYIPFKAALNGLAYLNKRFTGHKNHDLFEKYVLSLIAKRRKALGYEDHKDDDRLKVLLRQELNNWACNMNDEECVETYVKKFEEWKTKSVPIKPNERATAYCTAIRNATENWQFLWEKYLSSNNAGDQIVIINALGCSNNTMNLEKYLQHVFHSYPTTKIRKQDSVNVFAAVYSSSLKGANHVLDFVDKNYKRMKEYYGGQEKIATILNGILQHFSDRKLVEKFKDLIERHKTDFKQIHESLKFSLKVAEDELKWCNKFLPVIISWLKSNIKDKEDNEPITSPTITPTTTPTPTTSPTMTIRPSEETIKYRLPKNIIPYKYTIFVEPHFEFDNFTGIVKIEAKVIKDDTKQIILHSVGLDHKIVTVKINQTKITTKDGQFEKKYDIYQIPLFKALSSGTNISIEIKYTGSLNVSEFRGFYKGSYIKNKEERWFAATHLEPIGARRMFPCFDEPEMKAVFSISVNVTSGYHALSNTIPTKIDSSNGNITKFVFQDSMRMSTYLVALVVSDFESEENFPFSVFARPNSKNQTKYALSVMQPLVKFFEEKLTLKYEMPKLDMVALPDFPAGAMENWGLLTYKESNLLYDERHSPMTSKLAIRNVIAHEISHQWFGNLVTPEWWKYLWLKEGFARYFQYHATALTFHDTIAEGQFVVDQMHSALIADSSDSTHPMSHDVYSPSEIRSMYDSISYAKGASVLRMVEKSYGADVFYNALSGYLKKRQYGVTTPEHLYEELKKQIKSKDDIETILNTWTTQSGYPVVHVKFDGKHNFTLRQERFSLKNNKKADDSKWSIPITWTTEELPNYNNTAPKFWMTKKTMEVSLGDRNLLTLNTQQSGFYRVNYQDNFWSNISNILESRHNDIHEINRAALIDDFMNLAKAGYSDANYGTLIRITKYLKKEKDYLPWRAFYNNLPYLHYRFRGREMEDLFNKFLISRIEPLYSNLGFVDEKDDDRNNMLRMYTREWACKLNIGDCRFLTARYFEEMSRNSKNSKYLIPPNYRGVVYCTSMKTDMTEYNYKILWNEYLKSNVVTDKLVILSSLACSQTETTLERLLSSAIAKDSKIRFQYSAKVFSNVYNASPIGVKVVMDFIRKNHSDIRKHFGNAEIKIMLSGLASKLSTYDLYKQYESLLGYLVTQNYLNTSEKTSYLLNAKCEFDWYDQYAPIIYRELRKEFPYNSYRLPKTIYPEQYRIFLTPNMEKGTFDGRVKIDMKVKQETPHIILNIHKLVIKGISVFRNYEKNDNVEWEKVQIFDHKQNSTSQQLHIFLGNLLKGNQSIMARILFTGTLNDDMQGFYRSSYLDSRKNPHWIATTHFEPTYARQAFPCFDQPEFKSKFIINIERPIHHSTLSNMPLLRNRPSWNSIKSKWDVFYNTKEVMSSYLVAFVVSEFESLKESNSSLNIWGRPEIVKHGDYAYNVAKSVLNTLEKFTNITYSFPKLDLAGIPDFEMGAMENWGLVTAREYGLFYDKSITTGMFEKSIITTIAHELAHMWFGNLVTCQWWDYIWLNEGLAEYLQWVVADMVKPHYKFMDEFVVYELQPAMLKDTSISTHPMTNEVATPEQINKIFDYVTYGKSASVLRMIFSAFDERIYKKALSDYLTNYKGGTVIPTNLWKSFDPYVSIPFDTHKLSVEDVMESWTDQPGYPVVHARLNNFKVTLTQERFLMPGNRENTTKFYWIPIRIKRSLQSETFGLWLGPEPKTFLFNTINEWVIVNYEQTGFYRVNYDNYLWQKLIEELNSSQFTSINFLNRAQIIDDLFNLARAEYVSYDRLLNASRYLVRETHHLPWKAFFNGLSYIYERFEDRSSKRLLNLTKYISTLILHTYNKVGFHDRITDKHLDELHRELILQWACKINNAECVSKSLDLFSDWRNTKRNEAAKRISPNARAAVYCTAIRKGISGNWKFLWTKYKQTDFASEKRIIINALGCSKDEAVLRDYLSRAIQDRLKGSIRKQDISAVFASVYSTSQIGVTVTIDFMMSNLQKMHDYFGNWNDIGTLFYNTASHVSLHEQYIKLVEFQAMNNISELHDKLKSAVVIAEENLDWYSKNAPTIDKWITKLDPITTPPPPTPTPTPPPPPNTTTPRSCAMAPTNAIFITLIALISYFLNRH